jgi:hypothetical protein
MQSVTFSGEAASAGLSPADLLTAELLNVIEVGANQRRYIQCRRDGPVVEANTSKDFLCKADRQALLFCANVEVDLKCKSLLLYRPANQRGLKKSSNSILLMR